MVKLDRYMGAAIVLGCIGCTQPAEVTGATGGSGGAVSGDTGGSPGGSGNGGSGGSGSNPTTETTSAISGSRLKAYWVTAADGSQQFMNLWRDTQLNIDCSFQLAPAGQYRCLPYAMPGGFDFFSDSGCSQPLGYVSCGSATPLAGYITVTTMNSGAACSAAATSTLYLRGPQYTGTVFSGSSASCTALNSASFLATYTLYSLGAPADLATFQQASYGYQ